MKLQVAFEKLRGSDIKVIIRVVNTDIYPTGSYPDAAIFNDGVGNDLSNIVFINKSCRHRAVEIERMFDDPQEAKMWADEIEIEIRKQLMDWTWGACPSNYTIDTSKPFEHHSR